MHQELEESSRSRRTATRGAIAAGADVHGQPVQRTGRIDTAKQIAIAGYNLARSSAGGPPKYGFTMTSIQKVGINPSSVFETPLAVYAYPVTPMMVSNLTGGKNLDIALNMPEIEGEIPKYADVDYALPFVDTAPYINFFGFNTQEGVFYTSVGMDDGKYRAAIDMLFRQFSGNKALGADNPERRFRQLLVQAQRHNRVGTQNAPAAAKPSSEMTDYLRLATVWTLTRALSMVSVAADLDAFEAGAAPTPTQSTISTWRALLLMVGIKAIVDDDEKGLIHKNEPEQMAIMDTSIIVPIQQFDNTTAAAKLGKDDDVYWRNNPDRANAAAETKLKEIQIAVDSLEQRLTVREFENLTFAINPVYLSPWMTGKVVGELKRSGLDNRIVKIVLDYGLREYPKALQSGTYFYVAVHDLAGDNRVVDKMTSKLMTDPGDYFNAIKDLITSFRGNSDRHIKKFIIDFFNAAFKKGAELAAQNPGEAGSMLEALARSATVQSSMSMSYFIQLVMPIAKVLPREVQTSPFLNHPDGERIPYIDMLRDIFGETERAKAVAKEQDQIQTLEKKRSQRPTTDDLYANLGDLDKLKERLKQVLVRARQELRSAQKIVRDRSKFFEGGTRLDIDDYVSALGRFNRTTIQSATPEQLQRVEAIWTKFVITLRAASSGPNYLQMTKDITGRHPGASNDEIDELMKDYIHAHAAGQVDELERAIEDLETEMTAQIKSMDDKSVEQSSLYEALLIELLKLK